MFRRLLFVFASLASFAPLYAVPWQSPEFGVGVTLPDSQDWVPLPEGSGPSFRTLVGVLNQKTNSMFSLSVIPPLAGKSYDDPAAIEFMKKDLTVAGYQILGYSKTPAGTAQCVQFPVLNNGAKGVVRLFSANAQVFSMALLRGDGKNALEDMDLARIGATFRITGSAAPGATGAISSAPLTPAGAPSTPAASATHGEVASPASVAAAESGEQTGVNYKRIAIFAGVLVFLLLMVWGIIGSGKRA